MGQASKRLQSNFIKITLGHGEACNFIKKTLWRMCFPVNFVKFLRENVFAEHLLATASEGFDC